ncbi:MAG TPA: hypothetical protein VK718_02390 [Ferruginibacter sp.]|jgi:hypothetical protein|nr:hypothetical protein [Ferruginibacter sp.]
MNKITASRKGFITVSIMIILSLFFFYVLKQPVNSRDIYIIFAVYTIGILWGLISFSKTAMATTKFNEYFSEGFKIFIIVTFFMVLYTCLLNVFNPQIREVQFAINDQLTRQGFNYTPAEIAENNARLRSIYMPMTLAINTVLYLVLGTIITTVTSAVIIQLKKK